MVFNFEKDVFSINSTEPYSLTQEQSIQLKELLITCRVFDWERHTEGEEESTGSFSWKLVLKATSGEYCTNDGYTRDRSHLSDSFDDFLSGFQRITEAVK